MASVHKLNCCLVNYVDRLINTQQIKLYVVYITKQNIIKRLFLALRLKTMNENNAYVTF